MRQYISRILIIFGVVCILAAGGITAYNIISDRNAGAKSSEVAQELKESFETAAVPAETAGAAEESEPEPAGPAWTVAEDPETGLPAFEADGNYYMGLLEIPALSLSLPVMTAWSYPKLKISPCRYKGSIEENDLILLAHNYEAHFGKLKYLTAGSHAVFTDVYGTQHFYEVIKLETLERTAIEEMEAGEWDLTLFTCTIGGKARVTVRLKKV